MIDRDKYIVMKREDLPFALLEALEDSVLDDAVVIRKQDVFAEAGLRAYASNIICTVEILENLPYASVIVDTDTLDHMMEIADFFNGEADNSRGRTHKIPD
jgi:hypothetical protein